MAIDMASTTTLLREILLEGKARTQSEIQLVLQQRHGINSSQSKISRLLHQIGAVKVVEDTGKTQYRLPHETGLIHELTQENNILPQWILSIVANETLIVLHTKPGAASMIARVIDQHRINLEVLGTIAGDDTIFVAPKNQALRVETVNRLEQLFNL